MELQELTITTKEVILIFFLVPFSSRCFAKKGVQKYN